ncbi:oligomeric complex COG6 [Tilletiaria anomala UBC 951]|uniref:Conserved oligomeric Golgi complex subunit 6 n=1 Tax=Tilletiaria anomala (strain ATCC 24038 / CBS 436.72 / UBC 951) TaxID=1037660 RepID=A0A066WGX4_TILAU|nr:oligomeric complex COG6 [Tilletiaria anomala UBC 951]KDN53061.1 oligomeric complex COG6 [Tilletiaria anomala UBC 951]
MLSPSSGRRLSGGISSSGRYDPLALRCKAVTGAKRDPRKTIEALSDLVKLYRAAGGQAGMAAGPTSEPALVRRGSKGKGIANKKDLLDIGSFRKDIEQTLNESMQMASKEYLTTLHGLVSALDTLDDELEAVKTSCEETLKKYSLARQSSKHLLVQTEGLQQDRNALSMQHALVSLFLERFTLTADEELLVRSKDLEVSQALFKVMDRLEQIRKEAKLLLGGSVTDEVSTSPENGKRTTGASGGIRAGIDVMDTTASQLNAAYAKIARWLSFEFRQPVREGMEVSARMKQAVQRISSAGREDLLRPALATLSSTRASFLSTSFQMALTVGGGPPSNLPRPIELHAHDPLRYVGDMLAWVHQALASEREFLSALFSEQEGGDGRRIGQRRRGLEGSLDMQQSQAAELAQEAKDGAQRLTPSERAIREMLDRNLEGCCRPLQTRIVQTVRSQEGCVTTFRLANLIDFYRLTITRTVGSKAALSRTLQGVTTASYDAFGVTLRNHASSLTRYHDTLDLSLKIPPPLAGAGVALKELLAVVQTSLADEPGEGGGLLDKETREQALRQLDLILKELVDAMVALCERLSTQLVERRVKGKSEQDGKWEQSLFLCNCLEHIQNILGPHEHVKNKRAQLKTNEDEKMSALVEAHYKSLLADSHLAPLIEAIASKETGAALSRQPQASPEAVSSAFKAFGSFLASPSIVSSPRLALLTSPTTRSHVHQAALQMLADAYANIVHAVMQPSNRYEWKETLIKRSEDEVRLLLGVQ